MAQRTDTFDDIFFEFANTADATPLRASYNIHKPPQRIADMHYHVELGIVIKGTTHRNYRDFNMILKPGDIYFTGIFERHLCFTEKVPVEMIVLVIDPGYLAGVNIADAGNESWLTPFLLPPEKRPRSTPEQKRQILSAAERFKANQDKSADERLKWNCLFLLEILLIVGAGNQGAEEKLREGAHSFSKLQKAIEATLTSSQRIDSETAAELCSMSRRNFDRLFTGALGIPFTQFSLRCRLRKAARELLRTDKPLKNIADEFEFTDASHLANAFKSFFGCTPKEYRKGSFLI